MTEPATAGQQGVQEPPPPDLPGGVAGPAAPGPLVWLGGLGVRFLVDGDQTGGRFAVVEHPLRPRALASPLHTHRDEDEYSYVLEGQVGLQLGERVLVAGPGELVVKPRGVAHAFWNAGDGPARLLEIISPAGFERYFAAMAPLLPPAAAEPDFAGMAAVRERHHLSVDRDSVPVLVERHGLLSY
jgi:quercetin dioxygenase-like cupin family protein